MKIAGIFPYLLIAVAAGIFGWLAFQTPFFADDFTFIEALKSRSIPEASRYFYEQFNGRLFSHFFLCTVFRIFGGHAEYLFLYRFFLLACFVFALSALLKNYLFSFYGKTISFRCSIFLASVASAFFFLFFLEGTHETWFWVSATGVHLISVILGIAGFAVLFSRQKMIIKTISTVLIFLPAGGFSEANALMYFALLFFLLFRQKGEKRVPVLVALAAIAGGIFINLLSGGIQTRLGWLPAFDWPQAVKNSFHAMAMPFIRWHFLPVKLLLIAGLFFYARRNYNWKTGDLKKLLRQSAFVLGFIFTSFFITALILSDVTPDRAASTGYLAGTLFLFDAFIFRELKISVQ